MGETRRANSLRRRRQQASTYALGRERVSRNRGGSFCPSTGSVFDKSLGGFFEFQEVPHFTSVFYAERRLLNSQNLHRLLRATVEEAWAKKLLGRNVQQVAIDSTRHESGRVGRYYARRSRRKRRHFPKFPALCDTKNHWYLSG